MPTSDLHQHLDNLLHSEAGADVTFTVSGESFAAHKNILAARSPVFKAEFFGGMLDKSSQCVEIKDMDPQVDLHFIYTDMAPYEFDNIKNDEAVGGMVMAQHLLVAADRFGLDRLKLMSEHRLSLSIGIETLASTLALAEQFNCLHLMAKCVEFILATEEYRHSPEYNCDFIPPFLIL
jgi:speckle-type POZ protein